MNESFDTPDLCIANATVLLGDELIQADVSIKEGVIQSLDSGRAARRTVNAEGLVLLPGLVDLHGDAFERALCPRPGVDFSIDAALVENDRAMLSAGITTGFLSITDSFEPGLRSRERLRAIIQALAGVPSLDLLCDTKIHIRHEVCQVNDHQELLAWMESGQVHLLSIADHLPLEGDVAKTQRYIRSLERRVSVPDAAAMIAKAQSFRVLGLTQQRELSALALKKHIPLASHDDHNAVTVSQSLEMGVRIVEFPANLAAAQTALDGEATILLGAPNAVRGRSHLGLLTVKNAIDAGLPFILSSDYHYLSLALAPWVLAERGDLAFAKAWYNASRDPAQAAGLSDRGEIAVGLRADLVLMDPHPRGHRVVMTMVNGRSVFDTRPVV